MTETETPQIPGRLEREHEFQLNPVRAGSINPTLRFPRVLKNIVRDIETLLERSNVAGTLSFAAEQVSCHRLNASVTLMLTRTNMTSAVEMEPVVSLLISFDETVAGSASAEYRLYQFRMEPDRTVACRVGQEYGSDAAKHIANSANVSKLILSLAMRQVSGDIKRFAQCSELA